jgi:anti-sigma regulatory factor (Ser/Thr protein kinase)
MSVISETCLDMTLPAVPASVRKARNAVADVVEKISTSDRVADDVRLCVSEAVSNVVRHAYGGPGRGDVELHVGRDGDGIEVVVRDTGRGMARSLRAGKAGGYGMKIIDKLARRVTIESTPRAGTELRMLFDSDSRPRSADTPHGRVSA